jgi:hypothetical protein
VLPAAVVEIGVTGVTVTGCCTAPLPASMCQDAVTLTVHSIYFWQPARSASGPESSGARCAGSPQNRGRVDLAAHCFGAS